MTGASSTKSNARTSNHLPTERPTVAGVSLSFVWRPPRPKTAANMRTILETPKPVTRKQVITEKRATEKLVSAFDEVALNSHYLIKKPMAEFESRGQKY